MGQTLIIWVRKTLKYLFVLITNFVFTDFKVDQECNNIGWFAVFMLIYFYYPLESLFWSYTYNMLRLKYTMTTYTNCFQQFSLRQFCLSSAPKFTTATAALHRADQSIYTTFTIHFGSQSFRATSGRAT